jgi:hypothetical protein
VTPETTKAVAELAAALKASEDARRSEHLDLLEEANRAEYWHDRAIRFRQALERIAGEDYRGPAPDSVEIARRALGRR